MARRGTPPENRKTQRSWKDVARELSQEEDCGKIVNLAKELDQALIDEEKKFERIQPDTSLR